MPEGKSIYKRIKLAGIDIIKGLDLIFIPGGGIRQINMEEQRFFEKHGYYQDSFKLSRDYSQAHIFDMSKLAAYLVGGGFLTNYIIKKHPEKIIKLIDTMKDLF